MGLTVHREHYDEADQARFADCLQNCLAALQRLLQRPDFGKGPMTLGAELELSLVDAVGRALPLNREVLSKNTDPNLQLELDRFNLEYNLEPISGSGRPFSKLERQIDEAIHTLDGLAAEYGGRVIATGILPTLREQDLQPAALTQLTRYRALSAVMRERRVKPFEVHINGRDPLRMTCDDLTLEGANTSFQLHLRVDPARFAAVYNAAQLATPLAVAVAANAPIFMGHRLWDETRIALFKQAVDIRVLESERWHPPARVSFGHGWVRNGAYELFDENVALFAPLLPVVGDESALEALTDGGLPRLDELRLHCGTVWRWNRAVYDHAAGGHLRIEFRALPSGPTARDMAANAAFLLGLTLGLSQEIDPLIAALPFEYAHRNFYRAAEHGIDAEVLWPGKAPSPRAHPLESLAMALLDTAERGLAELGVERQESTMLLDVIRARLERGITPARWQRRMADHLLAHHDRDEAMLRLLEVYQREASTGQPVHLWSDTP